MIPSNQDIAGALTEKNVDLACRGCAGTDVKIEVLGLNLTNVDSKAVNVSTTAWRWVPMALETDADPEAIPYLWTDAVPFYAAWLALLASQTGARSGEADKMLQRYGEMMTAARRSATPDILPDIWDQAPSPVRQNQLGLAPHPGRGQAPPQ